MTIRGLESHGRARRLGDGPRSQFARLRSGLTALSTGQNGLAPSSGGQVLLLTAGVPIAVAAPLLRPDARGWMALGSVSGAMLTALVLSVLVPWHRLPARATLVFPLLVCAGLVSLDTVSAGLAAPLTGVLVLCFAYVGLTHPPATCLLLLPVTSSTFVFVNGGLTRVTSVRLILLALIWVLLAELVARQSSRQRQLSEALRTAAHTDVLTGVGNRRELDIRLLSTKPGDVIVLCDLDHFKALNDTRGHLFGDRVLADFGVLLQTELRAEDFAGRFGGEEFLLVLPAATERIARQALDRLHSRWAQMHPTITFSSGRSGCKRDQDVHATIAAADAALYAAKAAGRDTDRTGSDLSPVPA